MKKQIRAPFVPTTTIGNMAQKGIKNRYMNHPNPGVKIPSIVNNPIIPKINAPKRIRMPRGISGLSRSAKFEDSDEPDVSARPSTVVGSAPSRIVITAFTPSVIPVSKSHSLKQGAIMFWMIRLAKISGNVPSRP